jgi:hypothetical protein
VNDIDTPEPPPPLTQFQMNQFVMLSALPTLAPALAPAESRLRWLEAEVAALKAQRDEAFKSAINAALRADDHNADPLAEMWRELEEYQPQAHAVGYGMVWTRMCEYRTRSAAADAANPRVNSSAAARAAARAAAGAAAYFEEAMKSAADAVVAIRRAKEAR